MSRRIRARLGRGGSGFDFGRLQIDHGWRPLAALTAGRRTLSTCHARILDHSTQGAYSQTATIGSGWLTSALPRFANSSPTSCKTRYVPRAVKICPNDARHILAAPPPPDRFRPPRRLLLFATSVLAIAVCNVTTMPPPSILAEFRLCRRSLSSVTLLRLSPPTSQATRVSWATTRKERCSR